jgi:hypothetical protein
MTQFASLTLVHGDDKIAANVTVRNGGTRRLRDETVDSSYDLARVLYGRE